MTESRIETMTQVMNIAEPSWHEWTAGEPDQPNATTRFGSKTMTKRTLSGVSSFSAEVP